MCRSGGGTGRGTVGACGATREASATGGPPASGFVAFVARNENALHTGSQKRETNLSLQDEPAQVFLLQDALQPPADVGRVHDDPLLRDLRGLETDLLDDAL